MSAYAAEQSAAAAEMIEQQLQHRRFMSTKSQSGSSSNSNDRLHREELEVKKSDEEPRPFPSPTPGEITDYVPTTTDTNSAGDPITMSQFDGDYLEDLGLLKIDVLGLKTLRTIRMANDIVEDRTGQRVPQEALDARDDPEVYDKVFAEGDTLGIFQFQSPGMREYLEKMSPEAFSHITAMVALYRPGPLDAGMVPKFIKRMHGEQEVKYLHEDVHEEIKGEVGDILDDTYGIMVFQEQIMQVCQRLAGFSLGDADIMRRAVGKKKAKLLERQRDKFIKGCKSEGHSKVFGEKIFSLIETFADYGMNRCVTGDTKVVDTNTGRRIPIIDIVEGREEDVSVMSLEEKTQKIVSRPVTDAFTSGEAMTYELKTRTGRSIQATGNHPLYTQEGWKHLENLDPDDRIAIPRETTYRYSKEMKRHELVVLAWAIADGNLCHPSGFYVYTSSGEEMKDFCRKVRKFDNTDVTVDRSKSAASIYVRRENIAHPAAAVDFIEHLGLKGHGAREKFVPEKVFRIPIPQLELFLGRLWTGDGCVHTKDEEGGDIYYATSSKRLANDVQQLLLRMGIPSTIHEKSFNYRGGTKSGFQVRVSNEAADRFAKTIGRHLISKRRRDLNELMKTSIGEGFMTQDVLPVAVYPMMREAIDQTAAAAGRTAKSVVKEAGCSTRLLRENAERKGFAREKVAEIAEVTGTKGLRRWAESDIYWDEIDSIKEAGVEEVYDLTVEGTHNFVANDIIVHNSHSTAYAAIAYYQAYFKAHHPTAFFTAALRTEDNEDKQVGLIQDAKAHGIDVLPPSVNESVQEFTAIPGKQEIRFGLGTIKNVGKEAQKIIDERESRGDFQTLADFIHRALPNKTAVQSLIKAGALDEFDLTRRAMYEQTVDLLAYARLTRDYRTGDRASKPAPPGITDRPEWPAKTRFQQERDVASVYTTGQPIARFPHLVKEFDGKEWQRENGWHGKANMKMRLGSILSVDEATTRNDNRMWWVRYMTTDGILEEPFFAHRYEHVADNLDKDVPVGMISEADVEGEYAGMYSISTVMSLEEILSDLVKLLKIETESPEEGETAVERLREAPEGDTEVWVSSWTGAMISRLDEGIELDPEILLDARSFGDIAIN